MTEAEGKKKWCPFVRAQETLDGSAPAINRETWSNNCCGSQCMAWRWVDQKVATHGYCGLAGRP